MVDLMKIEDPFAPPEQIENKEAPSCPWEKPVLRFAAGFASLWERGRTLVPAAIWAHQVTPHQCLLYWCCRLEERELEPGLEGSELALGACRACGSGC